MSVHVFVCGMAWGRAAAATEQVQHDPAAACPPFQEARCEFTPIRFTHVQLSCRHTCTQHEHTPMSRRRLTTVGCSCWAFCPFHRSVAAGLRHAACSSSLPPRFDCNAQLQLYCPSCHGSVTALLSVRAMGSLVHSVYSLPHAYMCTCIRAVRVRTCEHVPSSMFDLLGLDSVHMFSVAQYYSFPVTIPIFANTRPNTCRPTWHLSIKECFVDSNSLEDTPAARHQNTTICMAAAAFQLQAQIQVQCKVQVQVPQKTEPQVWHNPPPTDREKQQIQYTYLDSASKGGKELLHGGSTHTSPTGGNQQLHDDSSPRCAAATGASQLFENVRPRRFYEIREGASELIELPLRGTRLATGAH